MSERSKTVSERRGWRPRCNSFGAGRDADGAVLRTPHRSELHVPSGVLSVNHPGEHHSHILIEAYDTAISS